MICVREAATQLGISYDQIDEYGNYLILKIPTRSGNGGGSQSCTIKKHHFIYWATPFNNSSISRLCKDKDFSCKYFSDQFDIPKTISYLDSDCSIEKQIYLKFKTHEEILNDIKKNFNFPVIVKKNSGSMGINVFLCNNDDEIRFALKNIFDRNSRRYDYIALAQEYVEIDREFRVIWFRGKIIFLYEKVCKNKSKNLSPLHNNGSTTEIIAETDEIFIKISQRLEASSKLHEVEFCGLDILLDRNGKLKMLELNTQPGFAFVFKHSGKQSVVEMYKKIFSQIQ